MIRIEFHIVKNYPFSNLNRNEYDAPKDFVFAGHPHGRISSQALKRSWREYFKNEFDRDDFSVRTRALPGEVRKALEGRDEEFIEAAVMAVKQLFVSDKKNTKGNKNLEKEETANITKQIVAFHPAEIMLFKEEFSKLTLEDLKDEKKMSKFKQELKKHLADLGTPTDIALWGRMSTSSVMKSTEASMQVAHAISTHPVTIEQDVFTAVDDILDNGAAMYDFAEYDSCCYYEYACLDFDHLVRNLGGDEEKAKALIPDLIKVMAYSNPSGKNTSTGTNMLPIAMMVEAKSVPYNLANAYAVPTSSKNGLLWDSVNQLASECDKMQKMYDIDAERYWFSTLDVPCESAEKVDTFKELIEKASQLV